MWQCLVKLPEGVQGVYQREKVTWNCLGNNHRDKLSGEAYAEDVKYVQVTCTSHTA